MQQVEKDSTFRCPGPAWPPAYFLRGFVQILEGRVAELSNTPRRSKDGAARVPMVQAPRPDTGPAKLDFSKRTYSVQSDL